VTRTERPRMRDVSSTAEEPMVCTTLRWREMDSNPRSPAEFGNFDVSRKGPGRREDDVPR
jgi:hypothetical protein